MRSERCRTLTAKTQLSHIFANRAGKRTRESTSLSVSNQSQGRLWRTYSSRLLFFICFQACTELFKTEKSQHGYLEGLTKPDYFL